MIDLELIFRFVNGRCHGNQIMLGELMNGDWYYLHYFALAFENDLEYHYVRINNTDDQATSGKNLVGFWPVPPEFTQINCVQQASFSTRVCLSTFVRWQQGYISLLLARGQPAALSGLYARLCHAFLVLFYFTCADDFPCHINHTHFLATLLMYLILNDELLQY